MPSSSSSYSASSRFHPTHFPLNIFLLLTLSLLLILPPTNALSFTTRTFATASTLMRSTKQHDFVTTEAARYAGEVCPHEEPYRCAVFKDRILANPGWSCNSTLCCGGGDLLLSDLCPITCGLCPEPCGGKTCKNFGKMDYKTCTCEYKGHLGGPLCEDCVEQDEDWCTQFLPQRRCGQHGGPVYYMCPHFCGLCPDKCGGKQCQNHGVLNITTCTCQCAGSFSGSHCEVCPPKDYVTCKAMDKSQCDLEPHVFAASQISCPYLCGLCP